MRRLLWVLPLLASAATIEEKTAGLEPLPGYLNLYWDAKAGKMWLEIDKFDRELLYVASLPAGVGSNDIGLDRGRMGQEKVVVFERSGPKVLLVEQNYGYRANSSDANERRAVQESFARSALWGFEVAAETGSRVLVDATAFFLRGAAGVPEALRRANQGAFRLDASRSAFYLPRTKNFPRNTEVDVTLTFTGDTPGSYVHQVVPSPEAITVREHHSFIELPDANFKPRAFDPRSGYIQLSYMDFATPVEEPIRKRFILRHRLEKKDPRAKVSEAVTPLVYYVDRGAPEPIRTALVEGARWWAQAFEAAGFKDAFRVEIMPEGADSMDVRYNVIQWVHRATRGWSYGGAISDPRTGEILKGIVTLGSLRIRQDYLIAEGLLAPYADGKTRDERLMEMSLSRIRQLSVHEVGHTLGLVHNFAASTLGRASVMDYPAPRIDLKNGSPDLANAYATGVGEWDKVAIAYGYAQFPPGADEAKELDRILRDAEKRGLYCISDEDARDPSGAHPAAHLWDTGTNAIDELDRMMQVRQRALARFGENNIRNGAPWSTLEESLVTTYLMHRYQVEAAVKAVGGVDYRYGLRGDGQPPPAILDSATQRRALTSLLATLQPEALELPERLLNLLPPPADGYDKSREYFRSRTGRTFDALAPVESAASLVLGLLLHPERAGRLVQQKARRADLPGLDGLFDALFEATFQKSDRAGLRGEVRRAVDLVTLYHVMALAVNDRAAPQARALALTRVAAWSDWMKKELANSSDRAQQAHWAFALNEVKRFGEDPKQLNLPKPLEAPPGMPIGDF